MNWVRDRGIDVSDVVLSKYRGIVTPVNELLDQIHQYGWLVKKIDYKNGVCHVTAESPHKEKIEKTGPNENTALGHILRDVATKDLMRTKTSAWHNRFIPHQMEIANAYAKAPYYEPKAALAWKELGDDSLWRASQLGQQFDIEHTDDPAPYKHPDDFFQDMAKKKLQVSRANTEHPAWSSDQVIAHRIVNDILGHHVSGGSWDWAGINKAAAQVFPHLSPAAQRAYWTENIARPAYALMNRGQAPHKIAFADQHLDQPIFEQAQTEENGSPYLPVNPNQAMAPQFPKAAQMQGTYDPDLIDPNADWKSNATPTPESNAYLNYGDPLDYAKPGGSRDMAHNLQTDWYDLPPAEGKQAIVNAFRVALLSPMKNLRHNAIHYQHIMPVPHDVTDPHRYQDVLSKQRENWNVARFGEQGREIHKPHFQEERDFVAHQVALHPDLPQQEVIKRAKEEINFIALQIEEEIVQEEQGKAEDKQKNTDQIEAAVNSRLKTVLKNKLSPPKEDIPKPQHEQQSLLSKTAGIPEYAENVPIAALDHLREWDRRPGQDAGANPEYWNSLKAHIQKNGFEDPITLEYNQHTGKGYIGEGNHRLQIAQELGMTHVPTMVYRTYRDDERMKPMHEPETYAMPNDYGHSQFPQYAKPSLIGLPTSDEPYEPATSNWYQDQYKTAAMTHKQLLDTARQYDHQYPRDTTTTEHEWPDGWQIRKLNTYNDMEREGNLMSNCFRLGSEVPHRMWYDHPQAKPFARWMSGVDDEIHADEIQARLGEIHNFDHPLPGPIYSLRDPDNIPHVSVDPVDDGALGRKNSEPKDEYSKRIQDWQDARHGPGNWEDGNGDVGPWGRISRMASEASELGQQSMGRTSKVADRTDPVHPEIRKWLWGGCGDYARALQQAAFDSDGAELRLGRHVSPLPEEDGHTPYNIEHIFAHDNTHAYDALGQHPLPYKQEGWKDEYDVPEDDLDYEWPSGEEDIENAYTHASENWQNRRTSKTAFKVATDAKTSNTMYHVAPADAEQDISQNGLRGDPEGWGDLVWAWDHLPTAQEYAQPNDHIYEINAQGLESEPGGNKPSQHGGIAYGIKGPIPPDRLKRIAAMTVPQQQRFREKLLEQYGPENTNEVHRWPDGWSLHHLPTWNELGREGEMMHHCWGGMGAATPAGSFQHPDQPAGEPFDWGNGITTPGKPARKGERFEWPAEGPNTELYDSDETGKAMSLRDPNGWPHASFSYIPEQNLAYEFGGHGGDPGLEANHAGRILDWAKANGIETDATLGDDAYYTDELSGWRGSSVKTADKLHDFLKYGLSAEQLNNIEECARKDTPDYDNWCGNACARVHSYLEGQGVPHEWLGGSHHDWIKLDDGTIIDPTITQFGDQAKIGWPGTDRTAVIPPGHEFAQQSWYQDNSEEPTTKIAAYQRRSQKEVTANKLEDFLMNPKSRPDLQTEYAQEFLQYLKKYFWNEKTDALMPWIVREWKKGRIQKGTDWGGGENERHDPNLQLEGRNFDPQAIDNLSEWYHSGHTGDIMQKTVGDIDHAFRDWQLEQVHRKQQEALKGGEVVHKWPDGWTMRNLTKPEELEAEGNAMGNCVGSYADHVRNGETMIHSLRDPQNNPHATVEVQPGQHVERTEEQKRQMRREHLEDALKNHHVGQGLPEEMKNALRHYDKTREDPLNVGALYEALQNDWRYADNGIPLPHNGQVVQIQGKGNEEPIDEYKDRLRDWFQHFPEHERPTGREDYNNWEWDDEEPTIEHPDDIRKYHDQAQSEDRYGLLRNHKYPDVDYEALLQNVGTNPDVWVNRRETFHDPEHVRDIYDMARDRGELATLGRNLENYGERADAEFDHHYHQNHHYLNHPYDPDLWEQMEPEQAREAEEAYEEEYNAMREDHEPSQIANHMYELIQPHWNSATNQYDQYGGGL